MSGPADEDEDDLAALVAGGAPATSGAAAPASQPTPPAPAPEPAPEPAPVVEHEALEHEALEHVPPPPSTLATARTRVRPEDAGSARYLPLPGARLIDQWQRFAGEAADGVGLLFVAARATPVHAISAGRLEVVDSDPHRVELHGDDGRLYQYGCLGPLERPRSRQVGAGDVIGEVEGAGPRLRQPYIELGIREADGRWCNPYEVLLGLPDADELTIAAAEEGLAVDPDDAFAPPRAAPPSAPPTAPTQPADEVLEAPEPEPEPEPDLEPEPEPEAVPEPEPAPEPQPPVVEAAAEADDDDLLSLVAPTDPEPARVTDTDPSCPSCGATNPVGARFCRSCRQYLGATPRQPAAVPPAPAAPPPPPPEAVTSPIAGEDPPATPVEPVAAGAAATDAGIDPRTPPPPARPAPRPAPPHDVDTAVPPATQMQEAVRVPSAPTRPTDPGPGQVRCPTCGEITDATHRFCRFGHPVQDLSAAPASAAAAGSTAPAGPAGQAPTPDRMQRARVAYDKGLSVRAKAVRATIILGAFGIGISMLPPWGTDVRGLATDQVERFLPDEYEAVAAQADDGAGDVDGFPSRFAIDGEVTRAWAVGWNPEAPVARECGGPSGAAGALTVTLPAGAEIERITVRNGLTDDNPSIGKHATPKVLDVIVPDGPCTRVELDEGSDAQHHSVRISGAKQVVFLIADVYPAKTGDSTIASLSELELETKK